MCVMFRDSTCAPTDALVGRADAFVLDVNLLGLTLLLLRRCGSS